ncbi:VanW family protein [Actinomyces minihominis]|uniref:VanW family protein n=1 Tax=Actinomyces minihominis TaxID=2002838 RepID=UPI000C075A29|nr:VanW family protein [Actinomyces minihominis]
MLEPSETTTSDQPDDSVVQGDSGARAKLPLIIALSVVGVLLIAYVGAAWLLSDRVPRGTTVAGVSLGNMSAASAKERLASSLQAKTTDPMTVVVDEVEGEFTPADAGLALDAEATVDELVGFNLSPGRLWRHIAGGGEVAPVSEVDTQALTATLEGMTDSFAILPLDGMIEFVDGQPQTSPSATGLEVDIPGAVETIREKWLTGSRPLPLPSKVVDPAISDAEVERALNEDAKPLVAGPVHATVGDNSTELAPATLASSASFVANGPTLEMIIDGKILAQDLREQIPELEQAPRNATVKLNGGVPEITPDQTGTEVNFEKLSGAVITAIHSEDRAVTVELAEVEADLTTAEVEALGVKEQISSFTTNLTSDSVRTGNLITGAAAINGVLVLPGETFSLLDTLGPITEERGYGNAGIIIDGVLVDGLGGGLSQLATTLYNAVFFAGLEDVEHQPHSQYIPRYPEGREATIFVPSIDVKFKNDSEYGVLIEAWVADGQITVAFWSTKVWDIEAGSSGRSEIVPATTVKSTRAGCIPEAPGEPGFLVTVYRYFYQNSELIKTESQGWRYQPVNGVECVQPKS